MRRPEPERRVTLSGIEPLGVRDGTLVLRDARGFRRAFPAVALGRQRLESLVAAPGILRQLWPEGSGWSLERAQSAIIAACAGAGIADVNRLVTAQIVLEEWRGFYLRPR